MLATGGISLVSSERESRLAHGVELPQTHQHCANADKYLQKRCGHELRAAGIEDYVQFDRAPVSDAFNTRNRPVVASEPQPTVTSPRAAAHIQAVTATSSAGSKAVAHAHAAQFTATGCSAPSATLGQRSAMVEASWPEQEAGTLTATKGMQPLPCGLQGHLSGSGLCWLLSVA